ncbi:MAG: isopentenyl-diphosphate Delta-isomerase [Candidatus Peregrinibacteria bacterium]|nr:isopentenyl-diphosphate Delta-isomerase [Candidatus Peregrinibacteria bacterium]MCB9808249.1 isopentenyl-diphosphate Delta-isomerase [Candidatus Peribacteria bacterium]
MKSVILTDPKGTTLGTCDIMDAHTHGGKLHKAFSIFIFSTDRTKLLIQKRAPEKKLFGGYWANTCCSHPQEKKPIEEEAAARLQEECGFTCPLSVVDTFVYKADDPSGAGTEYEYDTILIGEADESVELCPAPSEVAELKWIAIDTLKLDMTKHPNQYAPWFHQALALCM